MKLLPNYARCYVCGDANPRGLDVRFRRDGEAVVTRFVPHEDHTGYHGRVHGGILSALLDETMGWAPSVRMKRFCVAVELQVRFLRPAAIGAPLLVRGEMTADRGRLWEARGEIRDDAGTLIARGTGKYFPLSTEETQAILEYLTLDGRRATLDDLLEE
jgi:uncharacterized protein (TIGR00369 family)